MSWSPPETFEGYRLQHKLGEGAMGQVYLATDIPLDRPVAVKFIGLESEDLRARDRFLVEARAIARLKHPNVVSVHRVGEVDGHLYQVSEFVRGQTLDALDLPLPEARVRLIALQIASGLAVAHRRGVIHRDIKPANVMIDEEDLVRILDFGIAKLVEDHRWAPVIPSPSPRAVDPLGSTGDAVGTRTSMPVDPIGETGADTPPARPHRPRPTHTAAIAATVDRLPAVDPLAQTGVTHPPPKRARPASPVPAFPHARATDGGLASERSSPGAAVIQDGINHARALAEVHRKVDPYATTGDRSARELAQSIFDSEATQHRIAHLTQDGAVVGTPLYIAPELIDLAPPTFAADVYSFGALTYELLTGRPPIVADDLMSLYARVRNGDHVPIGRTAVRIDPAFAEIIERCLSRDPRKRYPDGEALRAALSALEPEGRGDVPEGNPYRGLSAFEAEDRGLFFGRDGEIRQVLERLSADAFVLVAGDSGTGKSSLCRAGVLPRVGAWFKDDRTWASVTLVPGRRPIDHLCAALAPVLNADEGELAMAVEADPRDFGRLLRQRLGARRGLVLFIDQFEELATLCPPSEAEVFAEALAMLLSPAPGLRVLATARADYLGRVAELPVIGDEVVRALYFLRPLNAERIREVVLRPAQAKGFQFEDDATVTALVESAGRAGSGALPLLQFALAELWALRDEPTRIIPAHALDEIGGVAGALSRHADQIIRRLTGAQQAVARRVLMRLVTVEGTRARQTGDELGAAEPEVAQVIEALVRGRLMVTHDTSYEIAHEALIRGWGTLREWLGADADARLVRERLGRTVHDWEEVGRDASLVWRGARLQEARRLAPESLSAAERAFVAASSAAERRRRLVQYGLPLAIIAAILLSVGLTSWRTRAERTRRANAHVASARGRLADTYRALAAGQAARATAFAHFDAREDDAGEASWQTWRTHEGTVQQGLTDASGLLEQALAVDPARADVRGLLADTLYARAEFADLQGDRAARDEALSRLAVYDDDGTRQARWQAPARVRLTLDPPTATVSLARYVRAGSDRVLTPIPEGFAADGRLPPGDYRIELSAPGRLTVIDTFSVRRGGERALTIRLPASERVPYGFVYIPPGRFRYGTALPDRLRRAFFRTVPEHELSTGGYLIARTEASVADWIEYVEDLPAAERVHASPQITKSAFQDPVSLSQMADGRWRLAFELDGTAYAAHQDEAITYPARARNRSQPMRDLPMMATNLVQVEDYLAWLDRSGRVPGARLCTDQEWERAARGSDGRDWPHGHDLAPDDANHEDTYGPGKLGPDAIGTHPQSVSPYGLQDMAGNLWERVQPGAGQPLVVRSGAYDFGANSTRSAMREPVRVDFTHLSVGFRVCADLPEP